MKKLDIKPALEQMERFIGFTIPRGGEFFVCNHDQVVRVTIDGSAPPEICDAHPYTFVNNNPDFLGIVFEQPRENQPLWRAGSATISYVFDPNQDIVRVGYDIAGKLGVLEFRTFSGDWFVASLSEDGKYLVLAEPYEIALYRVE